MNRLTPIVGAIASGLCLFVAVQHTVFLLVWLAFVPVFISLFKRVTLSPFLAGLFIGATLACCAFAWMIPGIQSFTGLSAGYGIFLFLICVLLFSIGCAAVLWLAFRIPHPLYIAAVLTLAEMVLQWAASGLPWFLFHTGNAVSANLYAIQPATVIGVPGISFIIIWVNGLIAKAIANGHFRKLWLPGALIAGYLGWGLLLLILFERSIYNTDKQLSFSVSILQQNVPPEVQWDQNNGNALVQQLLQQERQCIAQKPDIILWSESAIPWTYSPNDELIQELLHNSNAANISHILGMNTTITNEVVCNSAYCLLPGGKLSGRYDKKTPLLFIEQPWHGLLLPFFSANGYSVLPGKDRLPLTTPYGKAGVLICNESALSEAAAATVQQGAQFLLNLSNDGWFKDTYLAASHFYNARLRAVETRKDLAINSNNGRSGLVNASGRITEEAFVTIRPNTVQPIAVRYPFLPACICICIVLATIIINQKTKLT